MLRCTLLPVLWCTLRCTVLTVRIRGIVSSSSATSSGRPWFNPGVIGPCRVTDIAITKPASGVGRSRGRVPSRGMATASRRILAGRGESGIELVPGVFIAIEENLCQGSLGPEPAPLRRLAQGACERLKFLTDRFEFSVEFALGISNSFSSGKNSCPHIFQDTWESFGADDNNPQEDYEEYFAPADCRKHVSTIALSSAPTAFRDMVRVKALSIRVPPQEVLALIPQSEESRTKR